MQRLTGDPAARWAIVKDMGNLVPDPIRIKGMRVGKKAYRRLPMSMRRQIRVLTGHPAARKTPRDKQLRDPLGLGGATAATKVSVASGRAAAGTAQDPQASFRLKKALDGGPARTGSTVRTVGGWFAPDLVSILEAQDYSVVSFQPGPGKGQLDDAQVLVIDLEGIDGVWDGTLDAYGIGLFQELQEIVAEADRRGVTTWLVDRGRHRHRLGAVALRSRQDIMTIRPGEPVAPQHFTEDPGEDAPGGIADVLREIEMYPGAHHA